MQSYGGSYPYYGQPTYPQQQQYIPTGQPYGYPANYYPTHGHHQSQGPYEPRDHPVIPPPALTNGVVPPKESHRKTNSTPGPNAHLALKSSMKKSSSGNGTNGNGNGLGLTRQSTHPAYPQQNRPTPYMPQPTTNGGGLIDPDFRPLHMFMLFIGNNELRLENIMRPAMEELRRSMFPMWPGGIESDSLSGYDWTIKFRSNPWSLQGPDSELALDIVVHLFTLFARRGFSFQASMNTGNPPLRLIFEVTSADITSHFFLAYFSQGGRRFHLVKPPTVVDETLGHQLKAVLPRKVTEDVIDKRRTFEVKKSSGYGEDIEPSFFLMHLLKILSELGFSLVATLPLGRRGPLGVKSGREILVFRGMIDPASPTPA